MDDLIKREDAIKTVDAFLGTDSIVERIKRLPSADRPQGEWKPKNHHTDFCSNCGFEETQWRTVDYNFCPSCGIRMKGVDDEHTV